MEKPLGFSDAVASGSIKRISSFFIYMGFKSVDWIKVIKNKIPTKSLRRDSDTAKIMRFRMCHNHLYEVYSVAILTIYG